MRSVKIMTAAPDYVLGEVIAHDEQRCTRQLLRSDFGKKLFHKLILRAATLEAALVKASMPTKGATTSLQQHFQHEFVDEAIAVYTKVLLEGGEPELHLLARLSPPPLISWFGARQKWFPKTVAQTMGQDWARQNIHCTTGQPTRG